MFRALPFLACVALLAVPLPPASSSARAADAQAPASKDIDLVLCLDVSGSMNGLIDSAKIKLWDIVNEMARLSPTPNLRVALYSYGHSTYDRAKGWVRKDQDLTTDLDQVYKALNALTISGGQEYVARVSRDAIRDLKWSKQAGSLKLLFVCGNESANQDHQVTLDEVAAMAKKGGVLINTIFCGPVASPDSRGYSDFASKCGGRFMNIDQNKASEQLAVRTEFDGEILKLNDQLNKTYLAYGRNGENRRVNQVMQDSNARKAAGSGGFVGRSAAPVAALERAASKAGALYRNSAWDLVDRIANDKTFDITKLKDEELCDELKKLKPSERLAYVKKKAVERVAIQKQIRELSAKRQKKVQEELAKRPKNEKEKALDEAVKGVVRDQAKANGFTVPAKK